MRPSRCAVFAASLVIGLSCAVVRAAAPDDKQLQQDMEKLQSFNKTYGDSQLLNEEPQKLTDVVGQADKVKEEAKAIEAGWNARMNDRDDREALKIRRQLDLFQRQIGFYDNRIDRFKQDAPTQVGNHLDEAEKMSDEAVSDKKPLFFTGGIPQRMKWADEKLTVLAVIDPDTAKPLRERYEKLKADLPGKEAQLQQEIIAANELPQDNYSESDRKDVVKLLTDTWIGKHADDKVLAVRIPGRQWKRDTRWTWRSSSKAFEKTDRSHLQGQVIVVSSEDPKIAIVHPVDLYKDHLSNDAVNAVPWSDKDVTVQDMLLVEKVK
jgi:hypothetical protein